MGITLWYMCKMEIGQGPAYWWPLLCEVLQDHAFRFDDPTLPGKMNSYFYHRYLPPYEGEKEEHDSSIGSFRVLWDEIYQEVGGVTVPFWQKSKGFSMDVSSVFSASVQGPLQVGINFTLTGGQIYDATAEDARAMIRLVLLCFKDLYELCSPVSAEIHWEDTERDYAPWALFGEIPPDMHASRGPFHLAVDIQPSLNHRLIKEPLSNGKFLFLFDPIPIPSRRNWKKESLVMGWEFLTLFGQDENRIGKV